ncbi:MAG: DUF4215 domain-containing protein [Deltaproteobacteria bacterium]|nr:DUF4215 domain-containing protein [Deltaproteobacteria bacterium]
MRTFYLLLLCMFAACYSPTFTHCPDVDCPQGRVCDGQGGCALQGQVDACTGVSSGDPCTYQSATGSTVAGECTMQGVCLPLGCGNGVVTPDEVCDDGNNVSGDGCSADCQSNETCGNGTVDSAAGEQCDDGNTQDGDGCQHDCKQARCGDGVTDVIIGEECDSGPGNSSEPDAPCRPNCQLPRCGDSVVDTAHGEVCDDGNNQSADGCSGDCKSNETCGNHIVDALAGEVCDDGNTVSGDGCSGDCRSLEICGNGVLDTVRGEVCDDGNTVSGDGCSSDCKSREVCGNAIVDVAELCDLGSANSNAPDSACRTNCKLPVCGDAITDPLHGEACDNGALNSDTADKCRTNCQLPRCGDNIKDTGETCDDGNTTSGDGCSADCHSLETCGNSIVDVAKGEQCDNGAANSNAPNAACRTTCLRRQCGDSIVDNTFGEVCDLGANNSDLANASCRTNCLPARCGDGVTDPLRGEVCDDGNTTSGDGCSSACNSLEVCGNGIVDTVKGEQCDAAGANANSPNAPCRTSCLLPKCGDGIVDNLSLGEACDNGALNSNAPNAACRTTCQPQRCGDGIVDPATGEVCDDGNTVSGDGCSADCKSLETCGNSIVDVAKGEQCDLGGANSNAPNAACRTNCKLPTCGDNVVDDTRGELCDLGAANSNAANATCRTNCLPQRCGDTITDNTKGEICDDGNVVSGDGCSADCKSNETCGNGIIDVAKGEQCDNGGTNSNAPNATCRTTCKRQQCGDAIVDNAFGEVCDAGAANSNAPNAACRLNCTPKRCGDSILDTGEVCDDGNNTSGDGCSADCTSTETCGNGVVDTAKGEQCDAGAANSNAPNAPCRTNCKLPTCGDGIVDTTRGEQCDAGINNSNAPNAACRTTCLLPKCGDGVVDNLAGEVCDDSNNTNGDGCSSDCKSNETCGNGVVDYVRGESCDDGNTRSYDGCSACQPETLVVLSPNQTPAARSGEAVAYDAARQRAVLFGGKGASGNLGDTWEWDGASWTKIPTVHAPSPRYAAAMAYDAKRHRVVLFGGTTSNPGGNDTWEYDGVDWTLRSPSTVPSGRSDAAIAYDAINGRIVMFGGTPDGSASSSETWAYDGTTWTLVTSGTPSARFGAKMTFDSAAGHNYVVMFGGNTADTHTYTFNGSTWSDRGSTAGPATGSDVTAMAFDANIGKPVITDSSASTYEWSGAAWATVAGAPTTSRTAQAMTYDAIRKQLVVFGGLNGATPLAETWLRATSTWSQPGALTLPSARMRASAGYDPMRKRVVLFGGQNSAQRRFGCGATCMSADTWEWDGRRWVQATPTASPQVRAGTWLDFDPVGRVLRLYGGDSWVGGSSPTLTTYRDVWSYNGATWTQIGTNGTRTAARTAAMANDSAANRVVTFGGVTGETSSSTNGFGTTVAETWYWDGTWHQNTSPGQPGVRDNSQMAYDPVRNRTVLFAGNPRDGTTADDTWEWNNASWTRVANNVGPPNRSNARMFFNPDTSHVTLFGNSGLSTGEDVWEWNGTTWTKRVQSGSYPARYAPAAAYDAVNHEIVAFSGRDNSLATFVPTQDLGLFKSRPNTTPEICTSAQVDYDNDGLAGCADDECWAVCKPLCPPGTTCAGTAPKCGDGTCSATEDCRICPADCGSCTGTCGDFNCDSGETHATCPNDC